MAIENWEMKHVTLPRTPNKESIIDKFIETHQKDLNKSIKNYLLGICNEAHLLIAIEREWSIYGGRSKDWSDL